MRNTQHAICRTMLWAVGCGLWVWLWLVCPLMAVVPVEAMSKITVRMTHEARGTEP
jgi:hypothetical protein